MTTRLFFSLLFSLMCFQLSAQLTAGLKVQTGKAWQNFTHPEGISPLDGYIQRITHQGISVELMYQLQNPRFQVGIAPGLVQRGADRELGFLRSPFTVASATIYGNYIQAPILFQYRPLTGQRLSLFTQLGGGLGYLVGGYRNLSFWDQERPMEKQAIIFDNEEGLNRFDISLQSGLGIAYQIGPGELQLSGSYYYGLTNFYKTFDSQHRAWSVGLGYAFRL